MKTPAAMCAAVLLLFAAVSPSPAAITEPVITYTVADTNAMTLRIEGFNLPRGAVYMGKSGGGVQKLTVTSRSSRMIEAELQSAEPGTYTVAVAAGPELVWTGTLAIGEDPEVLFAESNNIFNFPATQDSLHVYCKVGPYTAGKNEKALIHGIMTYGHNAIAHGFIMTGYSTDGGTNWTTCNQVASGATNPANGFANIEARCPLSLELGTTYHFGLQTLAETPFATSFVGTCQTLVEIIR